MILIVEIQGDDEDQESYFADRLQDAIKLIVTSSNDAVSIEIKSIE